MRNITSNNLNNMIIDPVSGNDLAEIPQKNIDNEIGRINKIYEKYIVILNQKLIRIIVMLI
jgi:hypothetical protein